MLQFRTQILRTGCDNKKREHLQGGEEIESDEGCNHWDQWTAVYGRERGGQPGDDRAGRIFFEKRTPLCEIRRSDRGICRAQPESGENFAQ